MFSFFKKYSLLFGAFFLIYSNLAWADAFNASSDDGLSFSPVPGVTANVSVNQNLVTLTLKNGASTTKEEINVDTEKKIRVQLADYNFDGYRDFSTSHTDDGMGTYQIYQIYVFSPQEKKFVQLQPTCGDDFINVVVSKPSQRRLVSSYFSDNRLKICTKKY